MRNLMVACVMAALAPLASAEADDPLPSWNDGDAKQRIVAFVEAVTDEEADTFVPLEQRLATFDNDGTLWPEQPLYFQFLFAIDRVKAMAPEHPEWKSSEPFKSILAGDTKGLAAQGKQGLAQILAAMHAGMTTDEFNAIVKDWIRTARHPTTGRLYTQLAYQPMLEVLGYLRDNGFKTFIVSGGGVEFMRAFAEKTYGIPPEQVVGSAGKVKFEMRDGVPVLIKLPEIDFIDDKEGKAIGINNRIGRRPILAFGNSDSDIEMLQYTTIPRDRNDTTPRAGFIIHHTDAEREWAYDRNSSIGRLDKGLDEAPANGWTIVDMRRDWNVIYTHKNR